MHKRITFGMILILAFLFTLAAAAKPPAKVKVTAKWKAVTRAYSRCLAKAAQKRTIGEMDLALQMCERKSRAAMASIPPEPGSKMGAIADVLEKQKGQGLRGHVSDPIQVDGRGVSTIPTRAKGGMGFKGTGTGGVHIAAGRANAGRAERVTGKKPVGPQPKMCYCPCSKVGTKPKR